ncbi:MAG TPA: hypothetical protein VK611_23950 [Acidimicrobiales bacterium]|nr:hypothetical protein [Acidimicrobiales bacterium]
MRVLMTGFTTMQVGRPGLYQMATFANLLPEALRRAGHEVDQRAVDPGEPLGGYDAVLVGVIGPNKIGASHRYGALDTIGRARREVGALGFYLDDWNVREIAHDVDYLRRDPQRLVKPMLAGKPGYAWALAHLDELLRVLDALAHRPWPVTLVPKFDWGGGALLVDHVRGLTPERAVFLDPGALAVERLGQLAVPAPREWRDRVWVSAALAEPTRFLDQQVPSWPVERYGARARKIKEAEVVARYGEVGGCVVLPYPHAGSGWWRNRFDFASERGTLLLCDPRETADLAPGFAQKARFFEGMSSQERQVWADYQRDCLRSRRWPLDQLVSEADAALRRVVEGGPAPGVPGA